MSLPPVKLIDRWRRSVQPQWDRRDVLFCYDGFLVRPTQNVHCTTNTNIASGRFTRARRFFRSPRSQNIHAKQRSLGRGLNLLIRNTISIVKRCRHIHTTPKYKFTRGER
jgi:hypothetical protein